MSHWNLLYRAQNSSPVTSCLPVTSCWWRNKSAPSLTSACREFRHDEIIWRKGGDLSTAKLKKKAVSASVGSPALLLANINHYLLQGLNVRYLPQNCSAHQCEYPFPMQCLPCHICWQGVETQKVSNCDCSLVWLGATVQWLFKSVKPTNDLHDDQV